MRLRLTLRSVKENLRLPLSYNSLLSTALEAALPQAFPGAVDFVFSRLIIKSKMVDMKRGIMKVLSPTGVAYVGVPRPNPDETVNTEAILGMVMNDFDGTPLMRCDKIEIVGTPPWKPQMEFRLLSPAAVSNEAGSWLALDAPGVEEILRAGVLSRYLRLYGDRATASPNLHVVLEPKYLEGHGGRNGVMKRVPLHRADGSVEEVSAFLCPVVLKGDEELIAFAYDAGVGSLNTLGFGMLG